MQQAFQRDKAFIRFGVAGGEFGGELLDLVDDAGCGRTARGERGGSQFRTAEAGVG